MAKTRAQLRDGVRYLSDTVNSQLPTDTEINTRLDEAMAEAYDIVVARYDHYYVSTLGPFALVGGQGQNTKPLAADFYKDNGLDKDPGTSSARRIPRLGSFQERNNPSVISYTITCNDIVVYPPESSGGNYTHYYTPQVVPFVNDASILDVVLTLLQDFIMTRAAITVAVRRQQQELAASLMQLLGQHKARGMTMLANRSEEPTQSALVDRRQAPWWKTPWP